MKLTILLLAFAITVFSSCTTAYKTGQTPDDVYFSPAPPQEEYVQMDKKDDRQYNNDQDYYDDRYLRMKVRNRAQWSDLDDYYYFDSRYSYSSYNNWNNPWSPVGYWNTYYNPYCNSCCVSGYTKNIATGKPRIFNLNSYNTASLTNKNYNNPRTTSNGFQLFNGNRNSGRTSNSNSGSFLRNVFNGNNNNNNNSSSGNRSSGSSGGSSGGSSSGGGSAPVRRF